jgi:hypothetical protein
MNTTVFQNEFREWLGPNPYTAIDFLVKESGYSRQYLLWAAGLWGRKPWPGSRIFVRNMRRLGCTKKPWRDRSPEELARAFATRETLYDPQWTERTC